MFLICFFFLPNSASVLIGAKIVIPARNFHSIQSRDLSKWEIDFNKIVLRKCFTLSICKVAQSTFSCWNSKEKKSRKKNLASVNDGFVPLSLVLTLSKCHVLLYCLYYWFLTGKPELRIGCCSWKNPCILRKQPIRGAPWFKFF